MGQTEPHYSLDRVCLRLDFWIVHCGNPMTLKMVDRKIQTDLTRVKTIQNSAYGIVLDCFYTSEEAWIFNIPFFDVKRTPLGLKSQLLNSKIYLRGVHKLG